MKVCVCVCGDVLFIPHLAFCCPCCRIALQVVFVDGVTRLECMKKSDEVKVCSMPVLIIRIFRITVVILCRIP